jgi:hypothetical protein
LTRGAAIDMMSIDDICAGGMGIGDIRAEVW